MNQVYILMFGILSFILLYKYFPKVLTIIFESRYPSSLVYSETPSTKFEEVVVQDMELNAICGRIRNKDKIPLIVKKLFKKHKSRTPGFIYIYRLESGEFKIGRTAVGVSKRLKQWQRQCKKSCQLIAKYYTNDQESTELMIHQELRSNGKWVQINNCSCKVKHVEFFKGKQDELIECIMFWVNYYNSINFGAIEKRVCVDTQKSM
jgi:hypothetical protein